jgi:hypothetical protein
MEDPMTTRLSAGRLVTMIGVVHTLFIPLFFMPQLRAMFDDGLIASVGRHYDRGTAFWFAFFGFALMLFGEAIRVIERELTDAVPVQLTWGLGALTLAGVLFMPDSGFWLAVVPTAMLLHRERGRERASLGST